MSRTMAMMIPRKLASRRGPAIPGVTLVLLLATHGVCPGAPPESAGPATITIDAEQFPAITEPPCSYCSTQHLKGLIADDDRVIAWLRAAHNGGAFPIRHFLAGGRVVNDTYGLFFYDPAGDYVAAYQKDYGYRFHGWRRGVMVVQGRDGTLWSALSGRAFAGPQKGARLTRIPSMVTQWNYWMMLHPESTAYDLFDGKRYQTVELPVAGSPAARQSVGKLDDRLPAETVVMGLEGHQTNRAYPLPVDEPRAVIRDTFEGQPIVVMWYGPTRSAVAFSREVDGQTLTIEADAISPASAPFKDRETGTRWTLAGRGIDGPLRGKELTWVNSIQCRWFAWSAEYPETELQAKQPAE